MEIKFRLTDILWFVAVAALTIVVVTTNRRLVSTHEELVHRTAEVERITKECQQVRTEFSKYQADQSNYENFFSQGCKYMEYGLYQEAIACFESAKQIRLGDDLLEKLIECFKASNEDLLKHIKDADVKMIYATVASDGQKKKPESR